VTVFGNFTVINLE